MVIHNYESKISINQIKGKRGNYDWKQTHIFNSIVPTGSDFLWQNNVKVFGKRT